MNEELILILTFTPEQIQFWKEEYPGEWDDYVMACLRKLLDDEWGIDFAPDDINIGIKSYYQKKD